MSFSVAGLGCTCDRHSRIIHDVGYYGRRTGREYLECEKCPENHVPTQDKRFCIACPSQGCTCPPAHIWVERQVNGQLQNQAECIQCAPGSKPSIGNLTLYIVNPSFSRKISSINKNLANFLNSQN